MATDITPLVLSLISMIGWGIMLFLYARLAKVVSELQAVFLFQLLGIPLLLIIFPFVKTSSLNVTPLILLGILISIVLLLETYAFRIGNVSIVTPISNASVLITSLLGIVLLHESISVLKIIGILAVLAGIIFLSRKEKSFGEIKKENFHKGTIPAIFVALGLGIYFFLISPASRMNGWYYTALIIRITVTIFVFLLLIMKKQNIIKILSTIPWRYAFPVAFLDVISFSIYNFAVTYYQVSYVAVITSSSCLVTIILGYFFLREKLKFLQLIGILLVVAGIVVLQIQ